MHNQDESLLLYLNAALATTRTQEDFFTILVEKLRLIFPFDGIGITTLDAQGTYKRVLLSDYEAEFRLPTDLQELNVAVRLQDSLLKQLLESTLPFTAPIEELARYYPQSKALAFRVQLGIRFITLVPLRMGTTLVGMLSMASQRDPAFESEDITGEDW
jgi:formate hydrogenlyase transcriptional activator